MAAYVAGGPWHCAFAQPGTFESGPIAHRGSPKNAEPRPDVLAAGFITSQADLYVRNHGTIPRLSEDGYRIRIEVPGEQPSEVALNDLRSRYPHRSMPAVMQCAGDRRVDLGKYKSVTGDAWQSGAIGNAVWSGVGLGDVLRAAGVRESGDMHVAFDAHDDIEEEGEHFKFGVSIPLAKALAPESLIAFSMNGEALTAEHGHPVRLVIPGYAGVRSPKWLAAIRVQNKPSDNHVQQREYKLFTPDVTRQTVDLTKGTFINEMPLNSAILLPADHATVPAGQVNIRGWSIATAARVSRVEVSADERRWTVANLQEHADAPWSWTPWTASLNLSRGRHDLVVRAFDSAGGSQPASPAPIWNYPGYLSRAWHRITVEVV